MLHRLGVYLDAYSSSKEVGVNGEFTAKSRSSTQGPGRSRVVRVGTHKQLLPRTVLYLFMDGLRNELSGGREIPPTPDHAPSINLSPPVIAEEWHVSTCVWVLVPP